MSSRVSVAPDILAWACARSGRGLDALVARFEKLPEWIRGDTEPTLKQLESFAQATHTPIGYLFLPEPPVELLPIPDFRTRAGAPVERPSANLLDTLYTMQRRRDWLRETLLEEDAEPLGFVGSARLSDSPKAIAQEMRRTAGLEEGWSSRVKTWTDAIGELRRAIESTGVMAVINGVVANNTHRKLDTGEFQGFALCDAYAPVIFVNGADFKAAQMFTLAHELAHVWLGREGLSGFDGITAGGHDVERFCDAAAAEFLVPAQEFLALWPEVRRDGGVFHVIARRFKVSPIVAARRARDLKVIDKSAFFAFYNAYVAEENHKKRTGTSGGNFYNNQNTRVGERFAAEVIRAAKEGRLQYREAYGLTDLYGKAFQTYAQYLGFEML